mmetsp:Transcript_37463/g.46333  ORF Transcript_37463/g.46333 Transcript_37463/m.46333 type:complete len:156 (-) Transcript_37463:32-499(-)
MVSKIITRFCIFLNLTKILLHKNKTLKHNSEFNNNKLRKVLYMNENSTYFGNGFGGSYYTEIYDFGDFVGLESVTVLSRVLSKGPFDDVMDIIRNGDNGLIDKEPATYVRSTYVDALTDDCCVFGLYNDSWEVSRVLLSTGPFNDIMDVTRNNDN